MEDKLNNFSISCYGAVYMVQMIMDIAYNFHSKPIFTRLIFCVGGRGFDFAYWKVRLSLNQV